MWLRKAYLAFHRRGNVWMLGYGVTADQYVVLRLVTREPGYTDQDCGAKCLGPEYCSGDPKAS